MEFLKIRNISAIFKKFKKEVLLNVLLNLFSDILILFGILAWLHRYHKFLLRFNTRHLTQESCDVRDEETVLIRKKCH